MLKILFLGAHPDDVESGCGGLILDVAPYSEIRYIAMSQCQDIPRNKNLLAEHKKVTAELGVYSQVLTFKNRFMHTEAHKIRETLEFQRNGMKPDIVFCPSLHDTHQDHQTLAKETVRIFKKESVLFYETPNGCPHFDPHYFHVLSEKVAKKKLRILKLYRSQASTAYMHPKQHLATMIFWGRKCGVKYAEAFEVWRIVQN